jgi:uncharacterized protein YjiS (DUF1127 family)
MTELRLWIAAPSRGESGARLLLEIGRSLLRLAAVWLRKVQELHRIGRDRRRLRDLPDYLLKDIGIARADIDWIAAYGSTASRRRVPPLAETRKLRPAFRDLRGLRSAASRAWR